MIHRLHTTGADACGADDEGDVISHGFSFIGEHTESYIQRALLFVRPKKHTFPIHAHIPGLEEQRRNEPAERTAGREPAVKRRCRYERADMIWRRQLDVAILLNITFVHTLLGLYCC